MNLVARAGKLLICVVGRHHGEAVVRVAKAAGALGGTIVHGHAAADNRVLRILSLSEMHHDVVFIAMGHESSPVLGALRSAAANKTGKFEGAAVLLDIPSFWVRKFSQQAKSLQIGSEERSRSMKSTHSMICAIANSGSGDAMMQAARKAGADGGTIIKARGTGTEEDVKFFGVTLVPEKEMLLIVAEKDKAKAIMTSLGKIGELTKPGSGIVFSLPAEDFFRLGICSESSDDSGIRSP